MGVKFPKFAMVILAVLALLWPAGARAAEKGGWASPGWSSRPATPWWPSCPGRWRG